MLNNKNKKCDNVISWCIKNILIVQHHCCWMSRQCYTTHSFTLLMTTYGMVYNYVEQTTSVAGTSMPLMASIVSPLGRYQKSKNRLLYREIRRDETVYRWVTFFSAPSTSGTTRTVSLMRSVNESTPSMPRLHRSQQPSSSQKLIIKVNFEIYIADRKATTCI